MEFFQANPDLGAILAYVLGGIMKLNPVLTFPFPMAGIIVSSEAQISYPAAPLVPLAGRMA